MSMRLTPPRGHAVFFLLVVTLAAGASGNIAGNLVPKSASDPSPNTVRAPIPLRSETGVTRRELDEETGHIRSELAKLQRRVETMTGAPELHRPRSGAGDTPAGNANSADFAAAMAPVRQGLADLAFALNRLTPRPAWTAGVHQHAQRISSGKADYRINAPAGVRVRTVTIANLGDTPVVNPRISVNGNPDWFSTPDIIAQTIRPGMSDREKALALWGFVKNHRRHDHPGHQSTEFQDPVRMHNIYGYGYCKHAACVLSVLADQAGLQSRVWGLKGHVVPEIYFEGGWRMLDPDEEVYYFEDDGKTIAGVETLQRRPDLIRKRQGRIMDGTENLVRIYTTTENNSIGQFYKDTSEAVHTMAFTLRPGEALMRSTGNWGKYFTALYLDEPEVYGNGRFTYEPRWIASREPEGIESADNIMVRVGANGTRLAAADAARPAVIAYRMSGPYPYLDGAVELAGVVPAGGAVVLEFSEEGKRWSRVGQVRADGIFREAIRTGGHFRNGYGRPMYAYQLRLRLEGGAELEALKITSDIQVAPASLPVLTAGANSVQYWDETKGAPTVAVTFGYDAQ